MSAGDDVHLVKWPEESDERRRLADTGQLCLLVLEANVMPPDDLQLWEDWVRVTADPIEVHSRIERLRSFNPDRGKRPEIDGDGILTYGDRWVALGQSDANLAKVLCDNFGVLVGRDVLRTCFEPTVSYSTLAVKLHRVRRLLAPLGLNIATVRARGYILEANLHATHQSQAVAQ